MDSSFPMIKMAFASSCLIDSQGNLLIDSDSSEESDSFKSEHFVVYDPSDLTTSLFMNHFGKFNLEDISEISNSLKEMGILPITEEIKRVLEEKIEYF